MTTTFRKRMKVAREAAGLSQKALASAISAISDKKKISRTAIAQWESGATKGVEAGNLLKATQILNVRPEWLQFGTGSMRPSLGGTNQHENLLVPLFNGKQAANHMERDDDIIEHIMLDQELAKVASSNSFAVVIKDDSMMPVLKQNDIVIIDPDVKPQPGEIIAAKLSDAHEVVIRKYRPLHMLGNKKPLFELIPLNEDWPKTTIQNENQCQIIGTLIEHRCRRRV